VTGPTQLLLAVLLLASACNVAPESRRKTGKVDFHWSGTEPGKLSSPAIAEWCPELRVLEIRGIRGDTGVAVAIYPNDTLIAPGQYRVVRPTTSESLSHANVGVRWASQTSIKGFQGESGSVVVERARSGELSGRVNAAARSVSDTQQLVLEGTFKDITIRPQARGCLRSAEHRDTNAQPSDTQLH
jgi:hypothetical protein